MQGTLRLVACCALALNLAAFAQAPVDETTPSHPAKRIPVFGNADEFALTTDVSYYIPQDRVNRDIDLQTAAVTIAAHMRHGWEFQFDGIALRAQGYRTLQNGVLAPQIPSDALGLAVGPSVRWNFLQFSRFRPFVVAEGAFIVFDRPWPARGTVNDFFLRAGGGISVRVSRAYWIESTFHFAHISDGECLCAGNPSWQGKGISLGLRRSFNHEPDGHGHPGWWPFRYANENAWITTVEDYTPLPGFNRKNGTVETDMRELRISRAWHFPHHLELQLGGMATTKTTVGFGPALRWNFLERERWRLFADTGSDFVQTGSLGYIVPWGKNMGYNFFFRDRGGASFQLHRAYWLEASIGWAHVSSGFGWGSQLLPWSGQGTSISLRHTFGKQSEL